MIEFILNNEHIRTESAPGLPLLDFIRYKRHLPGTKIGCREGDCGACTVIEGSLIADKVKYKSAVSCLSPLINAHGKHIVTIEGLNGTKLSPVQQALSDHAGTQCGFCTPGFVVSMTAFLLNDEKDAISAISGNICRCTGYKSIEKAAREIENLKKELAEENPIHTLINKNFLPKYFNTIVKKLQNIPVLSVGEYKDTLVGGGTDLMVQKPDNLLVERIRLAENFIPDDISENKDTIRFGAASRISDFFDHPIIQNKLAELLKVMPYFASTPIRNMGTLAGNIVNASPIGDLSILFLALNADLELIDQKGNKRTLLLKEFFLEYKKTALQKDEIIEYIVIRKPYETWDFNFEKVSKRTFLDIASVNSALGIKTIDGTIDEIHFSLGGIGPYPKYMSKTGNFLKAKNINIETLQSALEILQTEISPISDIRGSKEYKRLLARQLFLNHFLKLFPSLIDSSEILQLLRSNRSHYEKH